MGAVEVHHVVTGPEDAPVVVLSNSMGADLRMWDGIVDALSEHFRVVRYDTRGHGQSPEAPGPYSMDDLADDVVALLDTLGVEKAHLVGLSLGGMMGMRLAARDPERIDRLVLLCTGAFLEAGPGYTERAAQVLACLREWKVDPTDERLNPNGSGISLGHPVGATGARILATMAHEMQRREARYGLETMCIGGGQGIAAVFERV